MLATKAYAAQTANSPLASFQFERRNVGEKDVLIDILYCGVCHSDIHQARNHWGGSKYPMVPGHEIAGRVARVGSKVTKFKVGDLAAVGCLVDSCGHCPNCKKSYEQYCDVRTSFTYNSYEMDGKTPTQGGYSEKIVVKEDFVLRVSDKLSLERVAPLVCAGVTTYSALRTSKIGKGHKVGIMGLGGLGHMAVKFAAAFGAEVTVLSTSPHKEADAKALGAHKFVVSTNPQAMEGLKNYFDFILNAVSAPIDLNLYLATLNLDGTMVMVSWPTAPLTVRPDSLNTRRRRLAGTNIGGIAETQEMLDYCAERGIMCDVEVIQMSEINNAYERMIKGDVHYRFVIDLKTL